MSGKSSQGFQWTDEEIQVLQEVTQNLKVEENYEITRFYPIQTVIYVLVFLRKTFISLSNITKPSFEKTFH